MKQLFEFTMLRYASFYDDDGRFLGRKRIKVTNPTFTFKSRTFFFYPTCASYLKVFNFLWTTKTYFYNINEPRPIVLKRSFEPILNAEETNAILETDVLKKLNALAQGGLLAKLLTPINIIILIIIGVIAWYLMSGGKIAG